MLLRSLIDYVTVYSVQYYFLSVSVLNCGVYTSPSGVERITILFWIQKKNTQWIGNLIRIIIYLEERAKQKKKIQKTQPKHTHTTTIVTLTSIRSVKNRNIYLEPIQLSYRYLREREKKLLVIFFLNFNSGLMSGILFVSSNQSNRTATTINVMEEKKNVSLYFQHV